VPRKEYLGRRITPEMEEYLQSRARFVTDGQHRLLPVEGIDRLAKVVYPIVASSDVSGAVVLLQGSETETDIGETETKLTQAAAAFLGKQLEL
jgi:AbrB family transcriptional regulator (stage V sporulation protein T)